MEQITRRILNRAQKQIKTLKEITDRDVSKKFNIPILLDELDAATFKGNSLSTSSTLADDEIEACLGAIAGKVNLIIRALKTEGIIR
jgi:transcription initiation factor IIE alpha subunit|tara:strand:+ start:988 stop:1248 length:261 start_codon:yes stop_codon:yes gene_type:complete